MSWTSPLTALPHLSDEAVAAFADGVLSDTARQRAQSHMAGCAECSDAVYGQRAARAVLRSAGRPTLPDGLFERLRELPITAELPSTSVASALSADGQPLFASFSAPPAELAVTAPTRPASSSVGGGRGVETRLTTPSPVTSSPLDPQHAPPGTTHPVLSTAATHPGTPHPGTSQPGTSQPGTAHPGMTRPPLPAPHPLVLAPHRHTSTRVGLGATAAAVLAVGVLVTTSANAGGVTPTSRIVQPSVSDSPVSVVPPAQAPMHMTLLSVPSSGR